MTKDFKSKLFKCIMDNMMFEMDKDHIIQSKNNHKIDIANVCFNYEGNVLNCINSVKEITKRDGGFILPSIPTYGMQICIKPIKKLIVHLY